MSPIQNIHRYRRLAWATLTCLSMPWLNGCSTITETIHLTKSSSAPRAPVVVATLKPVAPILATDQVDPRSRALIARLPHLRLPPWLSNRRAALARPR
jgi:hypothetical protein